MEGRSRWIVGIAVGLILAFGLVWYLGFRSGSGLTRAAQPIEWTRSTPGIGLSGPDVPTADSWKDTMCLGKTAAGNGDPNNSTSVPEFDCGNDTSKWCTVEFRAKFIREDTEKIRVTVSNSVNPALVAYIQDDSDSRTFRLSKKGCTDRWSIDFNADAGGDPSSLESEIYLWGVTYQCGSVPRTNTRGVTGKLYDSNGNLLKANNTT